jgi:hypothetical protein
MAPKGNYAQSAPRVGLDPDLELQDIQTFEIHRSRIPTDLFQSIVTDMDAMIVQYGLPHVHKTNEARSRFFSPVRMLSLVTSGSTGFHHMKPVRPIVCDDDNRP